MYWEDEHDYFARHWRLRRDRGRAKHHKCQHCAEDGVDRWAHDWAQVHGTDGEDPMNDYLPLCRGCHVAYDGSGHHQPHTEEARRKMSRSQRLRVAEGRGFGAGGREDFGQMRAEQQQAKPTAEVLAGPLDYLPTVLGLARIRWLGHDATPNRASPGEPDSS